jgi:hypothetical protein
MPPTLARAVWQLSAVVAGPTPLPTWAVAGTIWSLVGVILLALAALSLLEGLTYYLRQDPITFYVRSEVSRYVVLGIIAGLALVAAAVAAFVHFVVDVAHPPHP